FAVNVDRAATHPLHDAGVFERSAGETAEDEGLLRTDVVENAEDFDVKVFYFVAGENGFTDGVHAGLDVAQWQNGKRRGEGENSQKQDCQAADEHVSSVAGVTRGGNRSSGVRGSH